MSKRNWNEPGTNPFGHRPDSATSAGLRGGQHLNGILKRLKEKRKMGLFDRKKQEDDRTVFVEELLHEMNPHIEAVIKDAREHDLLALAEEYAEDKAGGYERELRYIHRKLLERFYDLAKQESTLQKFMLPIMMYLRRARASRVGKG